VDEVIAARTGQVLVTDACVGEGKPLRPTHEIAINATRILLARDRQPILGDLNPDRARTACAERPNERTVSAADIEHVLAGW
jgi:hypothetical protein